MRFPLIPSPTYLAAVRQHLVLNPADMSVQIRRPPPAPRGPSNFTAGWDASFTGQTAALPEAYTVPQSFFGPCAVLQREVAQTFEHFTRVGLLLDGQASVVAVGGHRGMGQNLLTEDADTCISSAYRENTLASFRGAAASGASFIEFDVQVTSDGVPVIWHDDCIIVKNSEGKLSQRHISEVSLAEFRALSASKRSHGLVRESNGGAQSRLVDWRCQQDDELPTLADVFQGVPEGIGFDIEVKMATPADQPRTSSEELERMVSPILAETQRWAVKSNRRIAFSSFDPDICAELRRRQNSIPVLFLSDGGDSPHADQRRTSLAAAIDFAAQEGLHGLVLDSGAVAEESGVVGLARGKGLQVLTYGVQNDDPTWVRRQYALGVQAAIVDDVASIAPAMAAGSNSFYI